MNKKEELFGSITILYMLILTVLIAITATISIMTTLQAVLTVGLISKIGLTGFVSGLSALYFTYQIMLCDRAIS